MKAKGNGAPQQCVRNLLLTVRGEVPYERIKGLDPALIDQPSTTAAPRMAADIDYVLRTYEPRATAKQIDCAARDACAGDFLLRARLE